MSSPYILSGLKVVELASVLAGPAAGMFLAENGAMVLKVENPRSDGDVTRKWKLEGEPANTTVSSYFSCVNWGKHSIVKDIKDAAERQYVYELIREADVVISSFRPGSDASTGMDYDTLRRMNSGLIYASVTGYGMDNDRPAYDAIVQAESGFMDLNRLPVAEPMKMPVAMTDLLAGHQLKEAILLALIKRMQTGKSSHVSVSLYDAARSSLANQASNFLWAGMEPKPMGSGHPNIVPYGSVFLTADDRYIVVAAGHNDQFVNLCKVLNKPEWSDSEYFADNDSRIRNKEMLLDMLGKQIRTLYAAQVLDGANQYHVPVGLVKTVSEIFPGKGSGIRFEGGKGVRSFIAEGFTYPELTPPPELGTGKQRFS